MMFCSTIIPTVGRESLSLAVCSVLEQEFHAADHEVIVVNDSGQMLDTMAWQFDARVRVINTNRRERSVARNAGAAIATGKYLHFLDDDDVLLPGAIDAFWQLEQESDHVAWLYGSYQTVDNEGELIEVFHPGITGNVFALLVAGESIPLQASLICTRMFYDAGAFDPNLFYGEDRDLGRRLSLLGNVTWLPNVVAQIRVGEVGSTSDWSKKVISDRWGREKALRLDGATARVRQSAYPAHICRRVSRAYLASAVWNLLHHAGFTALSRILASLLFAGLSIFRPQS